MRKHKLIILLIITITVLVTVGFVMFSGNNPSQNLTANVSESAEVVLGDEPQIASVSALPQKVKVGDILTIATEIKDKRGIEKVSAIMPYENNRADEIQLSLISGDNKSGKWQAKWKCHNTINIEYITTITAINVLGKSATAEVSWWDDTETGWISGWNYRKKISIEGSTGGAQTLYQVKLLIGESSGTSGTDVNVDGESKSDSIFDDIYFADSDGSSPIDFWRESITGSGSDEIATVWVEVPSIDIGDSDNATAEATIFLYYGNPSASSASNGTNTFEFFDDFEGASPWTEEVDPNSHIEQDRTTDKRLELTGITRNEDAYLYKTETTDSTVTYAKMKVSTTTALQVVGAIGISDTLNDNSAWSNGAFLFFYDSTPVIQVRGASGGSVDSVQITSVAANTDYWVKMMLHGQHWWVVTQQLSEMWHIHIYMPHVPIMMRPQ